MLLIEGEAGKAICDLILFRQIWVFNRRVGLFFWMVIFSLRSEGWKRSSDNAKVFTTTKHINEFLLKWNLLWKWVGLRAERLNKKFMLIKANQKVYWSIFPRLIYAHNFRRHGLSLLQLNFQCYWFKRFHDNIAHSFLHISH